MDDIEARFLSKVKKTEHCWLWEGWKNRQGYGRFSIDGKHMQAHRWAYERYIGPIAEGLVIDHLCRVRHCVNPEHLDPVTNQENLRRAMRIQCPSGHLFTPENTHIDRHGHRRCETCHAEHQRKWQQARFVCDLCGKEYSVLYRSPHLRIVHGINRAAALASQERGE